MKKRIAFIIPSLESGGAERVVSVLSNELISKFEVYIFVLYKCTPFYLIHPEVQIKFCKDIYNPNLNKLESLSNHYQMISTLMSFVKQHNISMVIGFTSTANLYAVAVSKLRGIPSIISERIHPQFFGFGKVMKLIRYLVYSNTNVLVVQTQAIYNYFRKFIKANKLIIIKNPIDPKLAEARNLKMPKKNIVLNVGRLVEQKNQMLLIKAFSKIKAPGWKLEIVGDGPLKPELDKCIKELNCNGSIELSGNIENIADKYNNASIFAFTSNYEGFPNALTEAMYFGLASISTECISGPSELINHGENGFLIPVGNQLQLEEKLKLLIENEDTRYSINRAAVESSKKYEIGIITKQWKELINRLI